MKQFTDGFKEQAVQKALLRGSLSIKHIAMDLGVGYSTLQNWIKQHRLVSDNMTKEKSPKHWTREERLTALMDTYAMNEQQIAEYCRVKGLYTHHLTEWRQEFIQSKHFTHADTQEWRQLKKENQKLVKELNRKDKALAETAALLVLQKKFQALLEDRDE